MRHFTIPATATTALYTLSLHDALPICHCAMPGASSTSAPKLVQLRADAPVTCPACAAAAAADSTGTSAMRTRAPTFERSESTRLNSSHVKISYAVFCLKKKKNTTNYEE